MILEHQLQELWNWYETMRTKNIDLSKRRIVNASPSVDDYDVVVRKELRPFMGENIAVAQSPTHLYTICFSKGGALVTGNYAFPPFIVHRPGKPYVVAISAVTPPATTGAQINPTTNGVTFLSSNLTLPNTATSQQVFYATNIVSGTAFEKGDAVNINVINAGTAASQKTQIEVWVEEA